ncbi:MAG: phospho-N-acetylmuramoyl-pentapeptide-transferase [Bacilli bacterium]|nr:phospho-N-acetylmuramoyl-pentapeptide-transferase [Mycoplasmatota bacterium]MDD6264298.1 phospho-N-acetylmuramoyl-pentapeptide-transferase [bacterium]MDD6941402.1 phospho-N-acetylmuramoyl-pentapeptide-transferase [bacterium]MDY2697872.1 phospho-N-acetylmuramoyl-pentapeptide-transferase [Bacilli bacterium]MEE0015485.1 phospho-N-acetylmuramoyl-pentapeptide-transferase [Bacilli bacterium]
MLLLTKAVFAVMAGFLISAVLGLILVPCLKKLRVGQKISIFVGETHRKKEGTPTMGGLIFIIPTVVATLALILTGKIPYTSNLGIVLLVFLGYACIGFIDDFLSIRKGDNEGLTTYQKLFMQVLIAIGFFYIYMRSGGQTSWVVGTLHIDIEMGWLYGLFILFVLVGASNAVNLTDGLDGLAGGLSAIAFIAFSLISLMVGFEDIGIFSLILTGSLLGFLIYNTYPAKIFMGDTGSLALGGVMGAIAILTHRELTLLVVASVFVIETLSVIIQTFWVQVFHKKVFLMTPLHHHFEKLGWKETDIVKLFWVVGLILSMAGIIFGVWL